MPARLFKLCGIRKSMPDLKGYTKYMIDDEKTTSISLSWQAGSRPSQEKRQCGGQSPSVLKKKPNCKGYNVSQFETVEDEDILNTRWEVLLGLMKDNQVLSTVA